MTQDRRKQFVADLAFKTLEQIEPGSRELDDFEIYSEEYFKSPKKVLDGMEVKDRPIGSGLGVGEVLLTPVLLWLGGKIADKVTDMILDRLINDIAQDRPSNPVIRFFKNFLSKFGVGKKAKSTLPPPLTIRQKQVIREETLADPEVKALVSKYKLSNDLVVNLVDAMVANLPSQSTNETNNETNNETRSPSS